MRRVRFYVVLDQGEWKIRLGHRLIGPFSSKEHAVGAAVDAANESGAPGHETEVLVQTGQDDEFTTEWTYGESPARPA